MRSTWSWATSWVLGCALDSGSNTITPDPEDPIDCAIVDFQAGRDREKSFEIIHQRFHRPIRAFLSKKPKIQPDECIDLTQDTFLALYTGLDGYRWESRFSGWFFSIAVNCYRKYCRHRGRADVEGWSENMPGDIQAAAFEDHEVVPVDSRKTPSEELLNRELLEKLGDAIGQVLSTQERRCVVFRVYHDLKYQEIADVMEIKIGTVKAHLATAREKLRQALGNDFDGMDI